MNCRREQNNSQWRAWLYSPFGARVVLLGDIAQTKAIEAGKPFDQLQKAGMATAVMDTIQRQCDKQLKKSVEYAAKGDSSSSLQLIKDIQEIKDHTTRYQAIAHDYCSLNPDDREKTIVVSGTNKARKEINGYIREGVGVAGQGQEFTLLNRRDSTQAERRYARNFHIGDVIQPERDYKVGLQRGELYKIVDTTSSNALVVKPFNNSGECLTFSPAVHRNISVYEQSKDEISVGDLVRMTRNDKDLDVANGDRFRVETVCDTHISLSNGKRNIQIDPTKPLHMDHAYVTTVHSSQGFTSDRVLIDIHAQSKTTAKDVYYVAISRARYEACVYTNDAGKLPKAVERENEKHAALELDAQKCVWERRKEFIR